MGLFDDTQRTHKGPALHSEGSFSFLNRSESKVAEHVRKELEGWYGHYPSNEQLSLRKRFRREFDSAFFELFIHEWLLRQKASVTVHPEIPGSSRRPDFLAFFPLRGKVIVESVLATDMSAEEASKSKMLAKFYDEINKLISYNFFISIDEIRNPKKRQPPARKLRIFLERELARLDPDEVTRQVEVFGNSGMPSLIFKDGDLEVDVTIIPKKTEARNKTGRRPLGSYPTESRWGGTGPAIKAAVARKASRYGRLSLPYVVAVNVISRWGYEASNVIEALFGCDEPELGTVTADRDGHISRHGLLLGANGPRKTMISAVLITNVLPWNIPKADMCMYHNPFASISATKFPWHCNRATVRIVWEKSEDLAQIFGLKPDWPGKLGDEE